MKFRQLARNTTLTTVTALALACAASAGTVTFSTYGPGTGFNGTSSLVLNSISGEPGTLTFTPNSYTVTGTPVSVDLGTFTLACPTCGLFGDKERSTFAPFTFDLMITDITDGATGTLHGTSQSGVGLILFRDGVTFYMGWTPPQLGPGTFEATTGSFGSTFFITPEYTGLRAPDLGTIPGQYILQGFFSTTVIPEPGTWALLGGAMIGLGLLRRKLSV